MNASAPRRAAPRSKRVSEASLPFSTDALQDASLNIRLSGDAFSFKQFSKAVAKVPGLLRRGDGRGLRIAIHEPSLGGRFHSHATIEDDSGGDRGSDAGILVRYEVVRGQHPGHEPTPQSPEAFTAFFMPCVRADKGELRGLLSGNFRYPSTDWSTFVPLPFSAPEVSAALPGKPAITGLDFTFSEPSAEHPLLRAFLTTYPKLGEIVVRVVVRYSATFGPELALAMLGEVKRHVSKLVTRTGKA